MAYFVIISQNEHILHIEMTNNISNKNFQPFDTMFFYFPIYERKKCFFNVQKVNVKIAQRKFTIFL